MNKEEIEVIDRLFGIMGGRDHLYIGSPEGRSTGGYRAILVDWSSGTQREFRAGGGTIHVALMNVLNKRDRG